MLLLPSLLAALLVFKPAEAVIVEAPCDTYSWTNDDDGSFGPLQLPFSLPLGNTTYSNVYASTNGTLTFGSPDGTYWAYPQTPSLSVAGYDWVSWGGGFLRYGTSINQLCMEWQVRPFPQSNGPFTNIKVVITVGDIGWQGIITSEGWLPPNLRRGIRFERGQDVVLIDEAFVVNGGVPVEVQPSELPIPPTPEPTPTPTETSSPSPTPVEPSPTSSPTQTPTESPSPTLSPEPTPTPSPIEPSQSPEPDEPEPAAPSAEPTPEETLEPELEPEPSFSPEPTPIEEPIDIVAEQEQLQQEALQEYNPDYEYQLDEVIPASDILEELNEEETLAFLEELDPNQPIEYVEGVIIEAGVAVIFEQLDNPAALLAEAFDNPGQVLEALGQLGADMTEQQREDSQQVVVASVIVSQVLGAMTLTTTPPAPAPSSGGSGGGGGGGDSGDGEKKPKPKGRKKPQKIKHHRRIK